MSDRRQKFERRKAALYNDRQEFLDEWKTLSEYFQPRRGRFLPGDRNKGKSRVNRIINSTGRYAANVLANGMHTGLTNPARPWFRLAPGDRDLSEFGPVKHWLHIVEKLLQSIFHSSNLYDSLPQIYLEMGVFGTGCVGLFEDYEDVIRAYPFTVGEYALAVDHKGRTDSLYREFPMTVGQIVSRFGLESVSHSVRNIYDRGALDQTVVVTHLIEPNDERVDGMQDAKNKPWRSVYYENGGDADQVLQISGYDECPIMSPRWNTIGGDTWGSGPGADALGDNKQLQHQEKKKAQAIDKHVDPPLQGPGSLRKSPVTTLPGGITFVDMMQNQKLEPVYTIQPNISELRADMAEVEQRINQAFFVDMFLMLAQRGQQMTATEVAERHEEKLMALGTVLHRTSSELLNPLIQRTFQRAVTAGIVPPVPHELREQPLQIEYISILAQAQQAVATSAIERMTGFAGNLAAVDQSVLDKIDLDQAIDEYGMAIGAPPRIIRSDDQVANIRQQRAEVEQQQQQMAMAQQAAEGAKTLSEVQTGEGRNLIQEALGL